MQISNLRHTLVLRDGRILIDSEAFGFFLMKQRGGGGAKNEKKLALTSIFSGEVGPKSVRGKWKGKAFDWEGNKDKFVSLVLKRAESHMSDDKRKNRWHTGLSHSELRARKPFSPIIPGGPWIHQLATVFTGPHSGFKGPGPPHHGAADFNYQFVQTGKRSYRSDAAGSPEKTYRLHFPNQKFNESSLLREADQPHHGIHGKIQINCCCVDIRGYLAHGTIARRMHRGRSSREE
ncbi:hypothetical protein FB451DRAFT_1183140 [Mycena latifolia]|nr:hypothetical protein FB451DRAFT_1183140 [Mycena latifolia]